jgi:hypothetical protein
MGFECWAAEVGGQGIFEAFRVVLNEIRKLENLVFSICDGLELAR